MRLLVASYLNAPQHMHIHHLLEDWAVRTPDAPALARLWAYAAHLWPFTQAY